jgi:hypothetical protein
VQQTVDAFSAKRCCQRQTMGRLTPTSSATCCTGLWSAEASTTRTRSICLRGRFRSAAIASSRSRPEALTITHTVWDMRIDSHGQPAT